MEVKNFINYYEIFELNPGASAEEIEHAFRHLARRYHPDNQTTGDRSRFDLILEAHDTLKDSLKRAQYHEKHHHHLPPYASVEDKAEHAGFGGAWNGHQDHVIDGDTFFDGLGIDRDVSIQNNLLTLLYFQRRRNIREPGLGDAELERLSGCPPEHLEFHLWYLKAKSWIARGDNGLLEITIDGVDRAALLYQGEHAAKLITDQS
jgi:curved DNA-binding protein CbpA